MIKGEDLINRDGGLRVEHRPRREMPGEVQTQAERLAALEQRIAQARELKPAGGAELHCGDCFRRGRDAVLRLLTGEP